MKEIKYSEKLSDSKPKSINQSLLSAKLQLLGEKQHGPIRESRPSLTPLLWTIDLPVSPLLWTIDLPVTPLLWTSDLPVTPLIWTIDLP